LPSNRKGKESFFAYPFTIAAVVLARAFREAETGLGASQAEVTTDRFFDFVITGYSLIDWVKKDPAMPGRRYSGSPQ
jgi:hypothetical protein